VDYHSHQVLLLVHVQHLRLSLNYPYLPGIMQQTDVFTMTVYLKKIKHTYLKMQTYILHLYVHP